jgi:nephrocystin-3
MVAHQSATQRQVYCDHLEHDRTFQILMQRKVPTMRVEPLTSIEKETLAMEYLAQFGKTLDSKQLQQLSVAPQTSNPLFLRAVLEELRVHGVFEEISDRIEHFLKAKNLALLYTLILERMEKDFGRNLVQDSLAFLWTSRRGLYESELLELLSLSRIAFTPFFSAIQESLVSRQGLLNFFHDYLRQAVESRYLSRPEEKRQYQDRLAKYFEKSTNVERKSDELPWLLYRMQEWARLKACLTDLQVFLQLYNPSRKYELKSFWLPIQSTYHIPDKV